jgi:hypothetical protein
MQCQHWNQGKRVVPQEARAGWQLLFGAWQCKAAIKAAIGFLCGPSVAQSKIKNPSFNVGTETQLMAVPFARKAFVLCSVLVRA